MTEAEAKELNQALATAMLEVERAWEICKGGASVAISSALPTNVHRIDAVMRPRPVSHVAALMARRSALASGMAGVVREAFAWQNAICGDAASRDMLEQLDKFEECLARVDQWLALLSC